MKCLIFIDHDIIYRNFVQSDALVELSQDAEVVFVFIESKRVTVDLNNFPYPWVKVPVNNQRAASWRRLFQIERMRWRLGRGWRAVRGSLRYSLGWKGSLLIGFLSLPGIYRVYRHKLLVGLNQEHSNPLSELFAKEQPDIILSPSALEGPLLNDLITLCNKTNIPSVLIMNSWDNPSTKRAVVGSPDWLLVWGAQTRSHAIQYMGMRPDRVVSFGAAQFEIFKSKPRYERSQLLARYKIKGPCKLILYAGSSQHSDEFEHVQLIDEAISKGKLSNAVVIYRPHPWGNCGFEGHRFATHKWKNVHLDQTMREYVMQIGRKKIQFNSADYRDTHDLLSAVDAVISPMSTILLEAAMHGKPILCYQSGVSGNSAMKVRVNQTQFVDLFKNDDVLISGDKEFLSAFSHLLEKINDRGIHERLKAMSRHFVADFDRPYGVRLSHLLHKLLSKTYETPNK